MRPVLAGVCFVAMFVGVNAGLAFINRRIFGGSTPVGEGALIGLVMGIGTLGFLVAERKGWIRTGADRKLIQRREELAADRERILADAKAKLN